jgi:hypothetical protein
MRRQGDIHSNDARRGLDVKASFKEFMKQTKGKEVNVIDKATAQRAAQEKKHSAETIKEFMNNKKVKEGGKSRR